MGDVQVCRICLNMGVAMQDLLAYPLETYFASFMIESKPVHTELPPYACYECAALLKKYHLFKQKCLQSQGLLCGIIDDCGKITPPQIKSINRQNLLAVSKVTQIDILVEETTNTLNIDFPYTYIVEETTNFLNIDQPTFMVENIKKEDHDDTEVPDEITPGISSDEEESESVGKKLRDLEKVDICVKMDLQESDDEELPITTVDVKRQPLRKSRTTAKKQGRLKRNNTRVTKKRSTEVKDDSLCEDEGLDDITVVTLSLEEQLEEINKRKQSSNYLNCPYQCHLCYKGFNKTLTWKHHLSKHSPNAGDIECNICKYRFKTKRNLQRHALNHGKKYLCNLCSYNSSNITTVKQHQGSHKGVTHKCNFCDEVFTVRTTYVCHMRIKHPSENICGYCGYSFYSQRGLIVHKNMVHKDVDENAEQSTEAGPYCAECDVKFISTEAYKRHMVMSVKHTQSTESIAGLTFKTFVISPPALLTYLTKRFERAGGTFVQAKLSSLQDPILDGFDVVVNCTGLGARVLVPDDRVVPVRGQIAKVKAPWIKEAVIDHEGGNYLIPNADTCVLGGTHQNDFSTEIYPEDTEFIMEGCKKMMPGLEHAELVSHWAGLRPGRDAIRLEPEHKNGKLYIHNYGHGGSGFTLCWGCGEEVVQILQKELHKNKSLCSNSKL